MKRILVLTYLGDVHAMAIGLALQRKGHEAILWFGSDFPTRQQASVSISPGDGLSWEVSGPELELADTRFDVVWKRRPTVSVLPEEVPLTSGDRYIAKRACDAFIRGLWQLIGTGAFWVNPRNSRSRSTVKPLQLIEAARAGLKVPPTLCSNDPDRIRDFLAGNEAVIYKPLLAASFRNEDGLATVYTTDVTCDDLPDDDILQLSSGIFQKKIEKTYELRVNYMGDCSLNAKLFSQNDPVSRTDWRMAHTSLKVEKAAPLPEAVDLACRQLMKRLGIVFGCFDFIVTPEGEFVFLEINEMGQFLWLEDRESDIMILDAFCEFLIHGRVDFEWQPTSRSLHFHDFKDEARSLCEKGCEIHLPKYFSHVADDTGMNPEGKQTVRSAPQLNPF